MSNPTRTKTNPNLQAVPTPEEPLHAAEVEQKAIEQLVARSVAASLTTALAELRRPAPAPSPETGLPAASLWALVPKKWRPAVVVGLLLLLGGQGSMLAFGQRVLSLPAEVDSLRDEIAGLRTDVSEIKKLLGANSPSSLPGR